MTSRQNATNIRIKGHIPEPTPGKKYQWIFAYNPASDSVSIYENGVLKGTGADVASGLGFPTSNVMTIGGRNGDASTNFDGKIFHCFLWERILNAAEAFDLYINPYAMFKEKRTVLTNLPSAPPAPEPNAVLFGCNF